MNPTTARMLYRTIENDRRREQERRRWQLLRAKPIDGETRGPRWWSLRLPRLRTSPSKA